MGPLADPSEPSVSAQHTTTHPYDQSILTNISNAPSSVTHLHISIVKPKEFLRALQANETSAPYVAYLHAKKSWPFDFEQTNVNP